MERLQACFRGLLGAAKQEAVLCIALLCALLSMLAVPPDAAYAGYVDLRVLALLFCLMLVVAGMEDCGLFVVLAQRLLSGQRRFRFLAVTLVLLPFFTSMLITNDVSLLTFVPFAILVLRMTGRMGELPWIVTLQTVAANLGSMTTPVGNPQNLFLFSKYGISTGEFFAAMLPLAAISLLCLAAAAARTSRDIIRVEFSQWQTIRKPGQLALMTGLFALCLLSVLRVLHYGLLFAVVALCGALFARQLLRRVDYGLLATFVCFFVFSGNLGRVKPVRALLEGLLSWNTAATSALASQVISNVPAAVLLSGFTDDWRGLLVGTNVGGLGTPIASLASLISFKLYLRTEGARPAAYLGIFTAANVLGLAVLGAAARLLGR